MKKFENPVIDVIAIAVEDVIATSGTTGGSADAGSPTPED